MPFLQPKKRRILVCGDRKWTDGRLIRETLRDRDPSSIECVIEGECRGADQLGRDAAKRLGITVLPFPANWTAHGAKAGPIRNKRMLDEGRPTEVLAFHDCIRKSVGTKDMLRQSRARRIPCTVISHTKEEP